MLRQLVRGLALRAAASLNDRETVPVVLNLVAVDTWNYRLIQDGPSYLLTFEHQGPRLHPGQELDVITPDQQLGLGIVTGCVTRAASQLVTIQGQGETYDSPYEHKDYA